MLKQSGLFLKWFLIVCIFQSLLLYVFFRLIYLPSYRSALEDALINRLKNKVDFYFPPVVKSFESKNDVAIMNYLEEIIKDSEILYARVIDINGKILAHNRIQEWGKVLNDDLNQKIILSNEPIMIKILNGYDYSIPIVSSSEKEKTKKIASFSVGISFDKINISYVSLKNRATKLATIIFLIGVFSYLLFFYFIVISPLNQLQSRIESTILSQAGEKLNLKRKDEIGKLANTIDKLIDKIQNSLQTLFF